MKRNRLEMAPLSGQDIGATPVTILIAHPQRRLRAALRKLLELRSWNVYEILGLERRLESVDIPEVGVVICGNASDETNWRNVRRYLDGKASSPNLIVCAQNPNAMLWADVLNQGGYSVLGLPLIRDEVLRTCWLAWLQWENRMVTMAAHAKARAAAFGAGAAIAASAAA